MKITGIKTFMTHWMNRPRALIKVETDENLYGWGEAYNHGPDLAIKPVINYIFEMIKGEDPRRIEYLMLKLYQQFRFPPGSIGLAAMSAIDHALWDISGKAAGLPVYMLLGGTARDRVQVYCGIDGTNGKKVAEQAIKLNEEYGITAFKTSPYQIDLNKNRWGLVCKTAAKYFEEIREHTNKNWEFAFDPHAKIYEPILALQLANALAPYDHLFYEEPHRPEHIKAWSRLRSHHSAGYLRLRRTIRNEKNRHYCRCTLCHNCTTQSNGAACYGGKRTLRRQHTQF